MSMLVISIVLEAAVAIVAVLAARKGKPYLYGLAFTFGAYVLYDLARLLQWDVHGGLLSGLFLLATITALIAVWGLDRKSCRLTPVYVAFSNAYGYNVFRSQSGETVGKPLESPPASFATPLAASRHPQRPLSAPVASPRTARGIANKTDQ
jgi:hypothetical protein